MFEMAVGYVIGMLTGYLIFRSSVVQAHKELKDYIDELVRDFYGTDEGDWFR